jgi:hypothetical protein
MEDYEICNAIHKRHRLKIWYRGGERIIEPYAFGAGDGGAPLLRAYQTSGYSRSRATGWKLFHVAEIEQFTVLEETFDAPRTGYMRNDPALVKINCEV